MKNYFYGILGTVLVALPTITFAQGGGADSGQAANRPFDRSVDTPETFSELVGFFLGLINQIIPLIFGLAFLFIVWKLIDAWIIHPDDGSRREEGKTIIITGVIVLVLMVSAWGILNLLINSL
jgi:hypothetical protein